MVRLRIDIRASAPQWRFSNMLATKRARLTPLEPEFTGTLALSLYVYNGDEARTGMGILILSGLGEEIEMLRFGR